ncbi:hypothetical protein PPERSA_03826 [Pseudocohnilembus persalinus]|uniref:Papain family cysteine protease n=1 Tax=Pseudocohnilembus persalinus TaxID=266149 RepID=A0A0V0QUH5_PSEPJ|nr:hypothetical protein PPERSA_03826 [Pseudocohnilembus persalinus]|eukprot:KRX05889.1 hypothetical protein PPERSA_03826 [Pseudocohnilembus persalinus]
MKIKLQIVFIAILLLLQNYKLQVQSLQTIVDENVNLQEEFEKFKLKFDKNYENLEEEKQKFRNFVENYFMVQELNANSNGFVEYALSQFHDLSQEEFENQILMNQGSPITFEKTRYRQIPENYLEDGEIPSSWNWVDYGAVSPVKDQGSVGTCWAFSTVGNVEGVWYLAGNDLIELSEQQLNDCASTQEPSQKRAICGVFGGWPYLALTYIIDVGGMNSLEDYRYCVGIKQKDNPCYPCSAPGYNEQLCGPGSYPPSCDFIKYPCRMSEYKKVAQLESWELLSSDEEILKKQLYENGPISVLLNARQLSSYKKGVYSPKKCDPEILNHAVLLVGYGHDEESGLDYWIVKNSWGTGWGLDGYFWIERGVGKCGINAQPVTGIVGQEFIKGPRKFEKKQKV